MAAVPRIISRCLAWHVHPRSLTFCKPSRNTHVWQTPTGYDTGIQIYNPLKKCKVSLIVRNPKLVWWYSCGPTVYDSAHIGHACSYIKLDIIQRILADYFKVSVVTCMGITDIDDKIIKRAQELNVDYKVLTNKYKKEFFHDMSALNIRHPHLNLLVTDHIPQIVNFVENILQKNLAYVSPEGNVFFDTSKYENYGIFMPPMQTEDSTYTGKKSARDFALWKAAKPNEPKWDSPWGPGRPGWHIECSAMASSAFGNSIDIHTGGADLMFPHHENEEAQCCAYHSSKQWVNYWIHTGLLHMTKTEKMSKSLGNTVTVGEFLDKHSADHFRMFCLLSHYRNGMAYDDTALDTAKGVYTKLVSFFSDSESYISGQLICEPINEEVLLQTMEETQSKVHAALCDDFNTVEAVNAIMELVGTTNKMLQRQVKVCQTSRSIAAVLSVVYFVEAVTTTFGLNLSCRMSNQDKETQTQTNIQEELLECSVQFRSKIRSASLGHEQSQKLLQACDDYRCALLQLGIEVKDRSKDSSWHFVERKTVSNS